MIRAHHTTTRVWYADTAEEEAVHERYEALAQLERMSPHERSLLNLGTLRRESGLDFRSFTEKEIH